MAYSPLSRREGCQLCVGIKLPERSVTTSHVANLNSKLNSLRVSSHTASSICLHSTSMCNILVICFTHCSLDLAIHLGSRHCMLLTNVCCNGAFFSSFSRAIKSLLQSNLTSIACLSDTCFEDLSCFRVVSAVNPMSICEASLCSRLSWKGTARSLSVDVASCRCLSTTNRPMSPANNSNKQNV